MGCERIGLGDVRVVFLLREIAEGHRNRLGPCLEIARGYSGDGAESFITFAGPNAEVEHVAIFGCGPEGDILRIENALGEDGCFLKFFPVNAIGGGKAEEAVFIISGHGFELLAGISVGIGIKKWGEIVGDLHLRVILDQKDIGIVAIFEGEEPELGFDPGFPVPAFGVAGEGSGGDGAMPTVIHAEEITVLDDYAIEAVSPFPGLVEGDRECRGGGIDEFVGNTREFLDEMAVEEGFASRANGQGGGVGHGAKELL